MDAQAFFKLSTLYPSGIKYQPMAMMKAGSGWRVLYVENVPWVGAYIDTGKGVDWLCQGECRENI